MRYSEIQHCPAQADSLPHLPSRAARGEAQSRLVTGVEERLRPPSGERKSERIAALRQMVAKLESAALTAGQDQPAKLPLGLPQLRAHLTGSPAGDTGLTCGVLHEVLAATHGDVPAAFGFGFALTACAQQIRAGPAIFVAARRALDFGQPYGHGLAQHGLDVDRLLLVEARSDTDALWAIEEALRSQASPSMVMGALAGDLDFTSSRRLNLAAGTQRTPLVLLPGACTCTTAAATRWRIACAPAARDRYGTFANWRWQVALERCRNGRPGQWLIEWDHVAHRFRMVEELADRAPVARPALRRVG
jgi:protein ImuA